MQTGIYAGQPDLDLERDKPIPAKVLEVIEANVYKVLVYDANPPHVEVYALIGVKTDGNQKAYDYSLKKLLNQTVYLVADPSLPKTEGINYAYVYVDFHLSHNQDLIDQGLAKVDPDFKGGENYLKYLGSQAIAQSQGLGIFNFSDRINQDRIININAASLDQIQEHFAIDNFRASKWYARISGNPINTLGELRALDKDFFTEETILQYRPSIHLSTNLQTALAYEIKTLFGKISNQSTWVDQVLSYRLLRPQIRQDDFNHMPIPSQIRKRLYPYLTFDQDYYHFIGANKAVNLNTANEDQIANTLGISKGQALLLKNYARTSTYPLRNIEEVFKAHFPLNKLAGSYEVLSDKIRAFTDINTAGEEELRSLFGKISMTSSQMANTLDLIQKNRPFASKEDLEKLIGKTYMGQIGKYVYCDSLSETGYINLNTAGKDKIAEYFKLSSSQKSQLPDRYLNPSRLPSFLSKYMDQITLYTNINRAGEEEWLALAPGMTRALANDILKYRSTTRFYSLDDLEVIFKNHKLAELFRRVKPYLILQWWLILVKLT